RATTRIQDSGVAGADELTVIHTDVATLDMDPTQIATGAAVVDFSGIERLNVETGEGSDHVRVFGVADGISALVDTGPGADTIDDYWLTGTSGPAGITTFH